MGKQTDAYYHNGRIAPEGCLIVVTKHQRLLALAIKEEPTKQQQQQQQDGLRLRRFTWRPYIGAKCSSIRQKM